MEFRRWGNLIPQKHKLDSLEFHCAPVEYGIYAFPKGVIDLDAIDGCGIGKLLSGWCSYVKDADGKKVMMTPRDFDAIEKERKETRHGDLVIAKWPPCLSMLKGVRYDYVWLYKEDEKGKGIGPDDAEDYDKLFPVVKFNKPVKFNYNGLVWHHLETTYPYDRFLTNESVAARLVKDAKKEYVECSLRGLRILEKEEIIKEHQRKLKRLVRPEDIISRNGSWILTEMEVFKEACNKYKHIIKFDGFMIHKRDSDNSFWLGDCEGRPDGLPDKLFNLSEFEVFIEKIK